ncbi:MAG: prealbumin-like fold domain-containing protein, partial [Propionibacteriaceae bacterium]|nr:prealbumin-like fold domain-containing protein [Propionibacteriaceae bacterium]
MARYNAQESASQRILGGYVFRWWGRVLIIVLVAALWLSLAKLTAQGELADPATPTPSPTDAGNGISTMSVGDINPNLSCTIESPSPTVQAGQSATVVAELYVPSGLSSSADAGMLLVVPVMQDEMHTQPTVTGDAAPQYVTNYQIPGTSITLDKALLIWKLASAGGLYAPGITVSYHFDNGSTANGYQFPVQVYCFEAKGIGGANQPGTGIVSESGYNTSTPITLTATADESWSITKSIASPSSPDDQNYLNLRERPYADVANDGDAEDDHTIVYRLTVNSNKTSGANGRLFLNNLHVVDVLSDFLATGEPKLISVKELRDGSAHEVQGVSIAEAAQSYTIEFDVPNISPTAFFTNRIFEVTVVFDKDDYTNRYGESPVLSAPHGVSNTASISYTPTTTPNTAVSVPGNAIPVAFGWQQAEPTLPSLTINATLVASGSVRSYTLAMARIWESNPDLTSGSFSNAQFTLAKVVGGATGDNVTEVVPNVRQDAKLILGTTGSFATFTNIEPGWYRLWESPNINGQTAAAQMNLETGMLVQVTPPDSQGISSMYVDTLPYNPTTGVIFNNVASRGYIKIYTKRQQPYVYPAVYENFKGSLSLYDSAGDLVQTATHTSTDSGGDYVMLENVALNATFQVADATQDSRWVLTTVDTGVQIAPSGTATTATAAQLSVNTYTAFLQSNRGGFRAGVLFQNPDTSPHATLTDGNFTVTYKLYPLNGTGCSATALQENSTDVTFTLSNRTVNDTTGYVLQDFPGGTYCVKEVLATTSLNASLLKQYELYTGDDLRVTVTAGSYASQLFVANGATDVTVTAAGQIIHTSNAGQLAIRGFDGSGAPHAASYTITKKDFVSANDSWWSVNGVKTVSTASGTGDYRDFAPVGVYEIVPQSVGNRVLVEVMGGDNSVISNPSANSVTVSVAAGTLATPIEQAVTAPSGQLNAASMHPASVQTAAFVWRYKPTLSASVARYGAAGVETTSGMGSAQFSIYKLNAAGDAYVYIATSGAPNGIGVVTFGNLEAGAYLLVETTLPSSTSYVLPAYFTGGTSWFKTNTGWSG